MNQSISTRVVEQYHSTLGQEIDPGEIAQEVSLEFGLLEEDGYVFKEESLLPFETSIIKGHVQRFSYTSDYGRGKITLASFINSFLEGGFSKQFLGEGPQSLGLFVETINISGCEEDVDALSIAAESVYAQRFGFVKADVDSMLEEARRTKLPSVRQEYYARALSLEICKGPLADIERIEYLKEQSTLALENMRNPKTIDELREFVTFMRYGARSLVDTVRKWQKD